MPRFEIPTPSLLALHAQDPAHAAAIAMEHFERDAVITLMPGDVEKSPHDVHERISNRLRDRRLVVVAGCLEPLDLRTDLLRLAKIQNHFGVALLLGEHDAKREKAWKKEGFRRVWSAAHDAPLEFEL